MKICKTLTEYTETGTNETHTTTAIDEQTMKADEDIAIYTDASYNAVGQCGIGIHIINYTDGRITAEKIRLNDEVTIIKAELHHKVGYLLRFTNGKYHDKQRKNQDIQ